jgi:hypothetical protein
MKTIFAFVHFTGTIPVSSTLLNNAASLFEMFVIQMCLIVRLDGPGALSCQEDESAVTISSGVISLSVSIISWSVPAIGGKKGFQLSGIMSGLLLCLNKLQACLVISCLASAGVLNRVYSSVSLHLTAKVMSTFFLYLSRAI